MNTYPINQLPGRHISIDGENWLYFSGTGYLGVAAHPVFRQLVLEGMQRYGTNFGGSRRSNTPLQVFEEVELFLGKLCGAPAALTLSSGTLAGQLAMRGFSAKAPIFCAPGVHPAILPPGLQPAKESYKAWSEQLIARLERERPLRCIVYSNALDPLFAQPYDWAWLSAIPEACQVQLLVDDSHGLGVTGPQGAGIYPKLKAHPQLELLLAASMGKAFGIPAGLIFGEKKMLDDLQQSAHFGGASPAVPAYLYAFLKAQDLYAEARKRLQDNVEQFIGAVGRTGLFRYLEQFPVFYTPNQELAAFLHKKKIMISSFPYPGPQDDCITRVVLNSSHQSEDIDLLAEQVLKFYHTLA